MTGKYLVRQGNVLVESRGLSASRSGSCLAPRVAIVSWLPRPVDADEKRHFTHVSQAFVNMFSSLMFVDRLPFEYDYGDFMGNFGVF